MIGKTPRRWPSAKAQSEISEPNPYRARHRQPQIIDDGMQPKPTIFALSRLASHAEPEVRIHLPPAESPRTIGSWVEINAAGAHHLGRVLILDQRGQQM